MLWTTGLCLLAIMHGTETVIDSKQCNEALRSVCERCVIAIEPADCTEELPVFCQAVGENGVQSGCCHRKDSAAACELITTTAAAKPPKDPNLLAIIGGVAGSLALLIGLVVLGACFRRYRRRKTPSFPIELLHHLDLNSRRNIAATSIDEAT